MKSRMLQAKRNLFFGLTILFGHSILAQSIITGFFSQSIDKLNDTTSIGFYSLKSSAKGSFELLDLTTVTSFNTTYARGYNDGPVWKGKGVTLEVHLGITGQLGKFSYHIQPMAYFSQNKDFDLAPQSNVNTNPFAYQYSNRIDWVQQYGSGSSIFFHPGQTELKFQTGKFITALSTQNYSFGPGRFNPLLIGFQGGGFPHLRIGAEPFSISPKIGDIEINFIAGLLKESNYFDVENDNDNRYINGLFLSYRPSFIKNLKVGVGKVLYKQTRYFATEDILSTLIVLEDTEREGINTVNDTFDQLASVFIDWTFPEIGFRTYAEFGKNDFNGNIRNTLVEPEHARGYTIGFEKTIETKSNKEILIAYEHTNLSRNQGNLWRAVPTYYTHNFNLQGYTNNGQLIGAGIGPGGNSDHFLVNIDKGNNEAIGFLVQRIQNNRDYFVTNIQSISQADVEYTLGFSFSKQVSNVLILTELDLSHNFNRYYQDDENNVALIFGARIGL